jgi:hypothetical protein
MSGPRGNLSAISDIRDPQLQQVTGAKFAVDREVKQRQVTVALVELQANANGPDLLQSKGWLLADELAFGPGGFLQYALK